MPDVQEVFRMATQKVRRDPGAMERHIARQQKAARNRRVGAYATVAVLVAAAVAVFTLTRPATQGGPAVSPSQPTSIVPGVANGSTVDINTGAITPLPASIATSGSHYAVSPDHTMVAYNMCCTDAGPVRLANIDGTQIREVTAKGWDAYGVQWSPDGSMLVYQQRLASTYALGDLFVLNVSTGHRTRITNFDQTQRWGFWAMLPSFAPDSRSILFQHPRGGNRNNPIEDLWSVSVTGGTPTLVRRNAGDGVYSSDGKWLAYTVNPKGGGAGTLWITGVHGGKPRVLASGGVGWLRWSRDGTRLSYLNNDGVYVIDVAAGTTTQVAEGGGNPEWFDDETLIIGNPTN
jgi:WD40 repeat protein